MCGPYHEAKSQIGQPKPSGQLEVSNDALSLRRKFAGISHIAPN